MKRSSKEQINETIIEIFSKDFSKEDVRKIKRLAMKNKISLRNHKSKFCKKCFSNLKDGKIRVTKTHKIIECVNCRYRNKIKIS